MRGTEIAFPGTELAFPGTELGLGQHGERMKGTEIAYATRCADGERREKPRHRSDRFSQLMRGCP
eukprot:1478533-Rhodomonas_salina.2